jgi:type IV pilus assembly protein PilV
VTLLEAVISLTILLVGIVGTLQLQIFGLTGDEGGRSHTEALQVAHELLAGLQQLPTDDPRLDEQFTGLTPPAEFGHLSASGTVPSGSFTTYNDSSSNAPFKLPGVTLDSDFLARGINDPLDLARPRFQRRWTVWMPTTRIAVDGSKLIAVSVTWRERNLTGLKEVVLYGTVINAAAVSIFASETR